jgi:hypothetical protein
LPAPDHVRADDAIRVGEGARQKVEIAAIARQAVRADQDARIVGVAPFQIGHAVAAIGIRTAQAVSPPFCARLAAPALQQVLPVHRGLLIEKTVFRG